jgi:peptide/nickel transport system permease protein
MRAGDFSWFLGRRLLSAVLVLLFLTAVLFFLNQHQPGDPVAASLGHGATPAQIAQARHRLGYDRPLVVQYWRFTAHAVQGNLGVSLRTKRPVWTDVRQTLPASVELIGVSLVVALVGATVLGVSSAVGWRGAGVVRIVMLVLVSAPAFLVAILAVLLFFSKLGWLPAAGQSSLSGPPTGPTGMFIIDSALHGQWSMAWDGIQHIILPAVTLAILPAVAIGRVLRSSLVTAMGSDYARTATSKGLSQSAVVWKHCARNCLTSVLSMTGLQVASMLGVISVVETVFAWPGLGQYLTLSIESGDFPAILGVTLVVGVVCVLVNIIVDLLQVLADPRIALK